MPIKTGFGKIDITPRLGVELAGFGPYLHRVATGVRDPLYARAAAFQTDQQTVVIVSCDLVGLSDDLVHQTQQAVHRETGLPPHALMVHCTHTHSGPATAPSCGWGEKDEPYLELLPGRIAAACVQALQNLQEAQLFHAEVPCEGIGYNRVYDTHPDETAALCEDWRPDMPQRTNTTCHVFRVEAAGRMIGFLSYFGCHPVVCASQTTLIHGDYAGVATHAIEHDHPGTVGLFLQGAQGDINTCVVHQPQKGAMQALDIIAARYGRVVRKGLQTAKRLQVDDVAHTHQEIPFSRIPWSLENLCQQLEEQQAILHAPDADDNDRAVRMAMVYTMALRRMIRKKENQESLEPATAVHGLRIGPVSLLGAPLEIFHAIKADVCKQAVAPIPLVLAFTNGSMGYAIDKTTANKGGYEAQQVPFIRGELPFAKIHEELVGALLEIDAALYAAS